MPTWIQAAFVLALLGPAHALAQHATYPVKPIRWVIPFAPGGGTDMVARPVAQRLGERLGQTIVYDNRGGGGGIIAGELVARAAPDGYTLLVPTAAVMAVNVSLYPKLPFDPAKDFSPITKMVTVPNMLVAHPSFPPRTIQELVEYAKQNPGKVNWASPGAGAGGHLGLELFRLAAGIKVLHVPYKGAGPANAALLGGEVHLLFANPSVFLPHIKAGRLRALGMGSMKRLSILPDVPTFHESGFSGFEIGTWYGLVAPAGTPQTIISALRSHVTHVLKHPEIAALFEQQGAQPIGNLPHEFAEEIRADTAKWARVIREADIRL
jgi:tripartite-type tricarboxylate transporter receptor subunit TctC